MSPEQNISLKALTSTFLILLRLSIENIIKHKKLGPLGNCTYKIKSTNQNLCINVILITEQKDTSQILLSSSLEYSRGKEIFLKSVLLL